MHTALLVKRTGRKGGVERKTGGRITGQLTRKHHFAVGMNCVMIHHVLGNRLSKQKFSKCSLKSRTVRTHEIEHCKREDDRIRERFKWGSLYKMKIPGFKLEFM